MYKVLIYSETMRVYDVANKENISILKSDKISRGKLRDFLWLNKSTAQGCAVRQSLFTHPATSRTKGRSAITLLNPCNVVRPKIRVEESIFFRPFPRCWKTVRCPWQDWIWRMYYHVQTTFTFSFYRYLLNASLLSIKALILIHGTFVLLK